MTWDMTGVRAKLDRVEANLHAYSDELRRYIASDPHEVVPKFDSETGWHDVFVHVQTPPLVFGLIAGEAVHNLRSALDHLAWQLANLDGEPPEPDQVQFPDFSTKPKDFMASKRLNGMRERHRTVLEHLQPYQADDRPQVLEMLTWLSNTDIASPRTHNGFYGRPIRATFHSGAARICAQQDRVWIQGNSRKRDKDRPSPCNANLGASCK